MVNRMMFSDIQWKQLSKGEPVSIGSNIYRVCGACYAVIKVNKRFFGSMHICEEGQDG